MSASDKKRKSKQKWQPGSGWKRANRARQSIKLINSKVKRWKRYQLEVEKGTRKLPVDKKGRDITNRWDTSGLEKHLISLENIVKMGKTG